MSKKTFLLILYCLICIIILICPTIIFVNSEKTMLHSSLIVTHIDFSEGKFCTYTLSQKEGDKESVKLKLKTVCGLYNVPDQLLLVKSTQTLNKGAKR